MSTSVDTMKTFFNVLKLYAYDTTTDGVAILDHAVRTVSHFSSLQDAVNNFLYDISTVSATTGNPYLSLSQNCGIIIGADNDFSADTGAVSGYNAGMGVVKNAQDIVPENALLTQVNLPVAGSVTTHSYTGADGKTFTYAIQYPSSILDVVDVATSPQVLDERTGQYFPDSSQAQHTYLQAGQVYDSLDDDGTAYTEHSGEEVAAAITTMTKGVENFWFDQGLKLAYDSFGLDFNGKTLTPLFGISQTSQAETGPVFGDVGYDARVPANNISVLINSVLYTPIDAADPNGNTYAQGADYRQNYLDRTLAHELIHAVMQASGTIKDGMPEFFTEGVAELVHGIDDFDGNYKNNIVALASDSNRLTAAVPFVEGTGTDDAYPAGYMFLRYLCHQSLNTQVLVGTTGAAELFGYAGGEEIISSAASGSQINFGTNVLGLDAIVSGDDLSVATNSGNLIMRDARAKILNFANDTGTVTARGYFANASGNVDGRFFNEFEYIYGADNHNNEIYAGDGGSKLWGGNYGTDTLIGGAGVDEFVAGVACGSDTILNADSNDVINLAATTLDQISSVNVDSDIELNFSDGSSLTVETSAGQNVNFRLSDGSAYTCNSGQWTKTN